MFDTLDEKIRQDDAAVISPKERVIKIAVVALLSVLLFGGLYFAVQLLQ